MQPLHQSPHRRVRLRAPRRDVWVCLIVAALSGWLYFWSARQPVHFLFSRQPNSYYELLTAGFRAGHLSVKLEPHPALLALPDPYDPVANAPYRVHDMTLYHGKYYLYFGVTPVLIFFWPIVALTGWYPTEPCAVATFCLLGVTAGLALLCALRRRHFPAAPLWCLAVGGLCLAFGSPVLVLTVEPNFYQVPIACAFCLDMFMLLAVYGALHAARRPEAWMAAASLLFGLVVGARPDYLFGGAALLLPCAWLIEQNGGRLRAGTGGPLSATENAVRNRFLLATLVPAMICGAGLALYNWLRFGSVSEFGMHYQLAGEDVRNLQLLSLGHIFVNGFEYLLRAGTWQRYFPFFAPAAGKPYGLLLYAPWCWLMLFAFPRKDAGSDRRPRLLAVTIGCGLAANFLLLSLYLGTTERYLTDFFPACLFLGSIGALVLTARLASRPWWRRLVALGPLGLGLFTILVGSLIFAGRIPRPDLLVPLARAADGPVFRWERAHGIQFGDLRLDLELPADKTGQSEPLLETGSAPDRRDWVEIRYLAADRAQLALFHAGLGFLEGQPFPIPANRRISVAIRAGSLLPPFAHPVFAGWTDDAYQAASRDLRISVGGTETLRAALACYPSSPEDVRIGSLAWPTPTLKEPFSGRILASARLALGPPPPPLPILHTRAPVELQVLFPADRTSGTEPLLMTGSGPRSDLLSCVYDGPGRLRFVFNHFGFGGPRSDSVPYDPLRPHQVTIWMGSLAPEGGNLDSAAVLPPARRIAVLLDGELVFDEEGLFYPASPETILAGRNPNGASDALTRFTGLILSASSSPDLKVLPPTTRSGETGAVELQVKFPDGMSGSTEPLVATGMSGAGDILYARYLDPTHVSFGFHHWGITTLNGAPVEIDYARPHRLEITMDSLYPRGVADRPFSGRVRVTLDGTIVLDGSEACFPSAPYEIRIGANPLGGSISDPAFTGRILSVERKQPAQLPSAALWSGFGAVVMDTIFPSGLNGAAEPLVETGAAGAADLIYVRYVDASHVRFGVDHWGTAGAQSEPVEVDFSAPHRLELGLDALQPPGTPATHRVHVSLDGAEVWQAEVPNYPTRGDQIQVGLNTVGASSCREAYTGQILTLTRL